MTKRRTTVVLDLAAHHINVIVEAYSNEQPHRQHPDHWLAGEIELSHPTFVEHFEYVIEPEGACVWVRAHDFSRTTPTEDLLLQAIWDKEHWNTQDNGVEMID